MSTDNVAIDSYGWSSEIPTLTLTNADAEVASFTAPEVEEAGLEIILTLTVTDTAGLTDSATVLITVNNVDREAPVASAGEPQTVNEGDTVRLDAGLSTDNIAIDSYGWSSEIPTLTLTNADAEVASFTAPEVEEAGLEIILTLTVTDTAGLADSATVLITVNNVDREAPVASAGEPQTVNEGDTVRLDAGLSTDNVAIDSYGWSSEIPTLTLTNADAEVASFTAPEVEEAGLEIILTLTVTDTAGLTDSATVLITVNNVDREAPVAIAGDTQTVNEGDTVTLDAGLSTDNIGIDSYGWSSEIPTLTLTNADAEVASFTAPEVEEAGLEIILTLIVTDTAGLTDSATVLITVNNVLAPSSPNDFITVWNITAANSELTFPGYGEYTIDWGDGSPREAVSNPDGNSPLSHTYTSAATRTVTVSKTDAQSGLTRFYDGSFLYIDLLIDVAQWGTSEWTTMEDAFDSASNLAGFSAGDEPNLSQVKSMRNMFANASTFNQNIDSWNVSQATSMIGMFSGASVFNQNIGNWNVAGVTHMNAMFRGASAFNQNIGNWNVAGVTDMDAMFLLASAFNQDIGNWNVESVINMTAMFFRASTFNQDISNWNVESVTNMLNLFGNAVTFNQDISSWNVESVTNMTSMFSGATAFDQNLGDWYVVLSPTSTSYDVSTSQDIATISAQNIILDNQVSAYVLAGADADKFTFTSINQLSFTGDTDGTYNIDIEATDGAFGTSPPTSSRQLIITGTQLNTPPIANAGDTQTVNEGDTVRLDAGLSTDNVAIDSYGWSSEIPTLTLTNADAEVASFIAPEVEEAGLEIILTLTVTDTAGLTDSATVLITVNNVDREAPVASAGDTQTVNEGDTVTLDGSLSTDNIAIESYGWSSEIATLTLTNADAEVASFTAPEVEEAGLEIILTLIVTDTAGLTDSATVLITVNNVLAPSSPNDFITVWNITAANSELTFPGYGEYTIDWGDGSPREAVSNPDGNSPLSHTYTSAATRTVTVSKTDAQSGLTRFYDGSFLYIDLLIDVAQWGTSEWTTMEDAFDSASNLAGFSAGDEPNLSQVKSMRNMFANASTFNQNIDSWNVSQATSMIGMFSGASVFNQNIGNWNVAGVTHMNAMFRGASAFNQNIGNWNVAGVTDMDAMFLLASAFNQDIGNWNVESVINMTAMFFRASTFNQDISNWNVESVTNMLNLFGNAVTFNQDISSWNVESVTNMTSMFSGATAFDQNLGDWYVVLSPTSTSYDVSTSQDIATISAQNIILDNQVSAYVLAGADADKFTFTSINQLSFTGDTDGTYNIDIEATDGAFGTSPPTSSRQLIITGTQLNTPPIANAGDTQTVNEGDTVRLDAGLSTDNVAIDSYGWSSEIPTLTLTNADAEVASFIAPEVEEAGLEIILTLTVTDTAGLTDSATVLITVNNVDREAPVASAGDTQTVNEGDTVTLDGSLSTDNIAIESYGWSSEIATLTLTNADAEVASFTAPEVEEAGLEIILTLIVTDTAGLTDSATVLITVNNVLAPSSPNDFITVWNITAANSELTFPGYGEYTIDWGDGSPREAVSNPDGNSPLSHTYTSAATRTVTVSKTDAQSGLTRFYDGSFLYIDLLIDVAQWGTSEWTTMEDAFDSASNLAGFSAGDEPNLSQVKSMRNMFANASTFNQNIDSWNVSQATSMIGMFSGASVFNQNIGNWNVAGVTHMNAMFRGASAFNQNIGNWNVAGVTDMDAMFLLASAFNQDIGNWNVESVINMTAMFFRASTFNQDISNWNVESVTNMLNLFGNAVTFNQDISSWNVESVTNMTSMFSGATAFDQNLGDWYVVLSPTSTSYDVSTSQDIATISAQNIILDNQVSAYVLAGADADKFAFTSTNQLSFTGDTDGTYNINIEATDGAFGTSPPTSSRQLIITGTPLNTPPIANAGDTQTVNEGDTVRLDAGLSTDNIGIDSYGWSSEIPTLTLTNADAEVASFIAPEVEDAGLEIILTLTVTDTAGLTDSATVLITVNNVDREAPVASAGDTQTVNEGDTVTLDGSLSTDNIAIESYGWSSEIATLTLTNADAEVASFTAPEVEEAGLEIILTLIVTDTAGLTDSATVLITVNDVLAPSSLNDFITVWDITDTNSDLIFPGYGQYTIDWGDGSPREAVNNPDGSNHPSHTYTTTGASSVTISKTDAQSGLTRFHLDFSSNKDLLIDVAQWGRSEWTTMENAFSGASNLAGFSAADDPNLSQIILIFLL